MIQPHTMLNVVDDSSARKLNVVNTIQPHKITNVVTRSQ